jgi:8-oxo-dGTP diphosphatase
VVEKEKQLFFWAAQIFEVKRIEDKNMFQTLEPAIGQTVNGTTGDDAAPKMREIKLTSNVRSEAKQRPRLGCAGLIRHGEQVLLGRRNKEPNRGLWVLPGGGVEFCESFAETLGRELLEEAGIQVDVEGVFKVYELINPPSEHRVIVYMNGNYRSGEPIASSDLSEVRFFHASELKDLSRRGQISSFVEKVLQEAQLL